MFGRGRDRAQPAVNHHGTAASAPRAPERENIRTCGSEGHSAFMPLSPTLLLPSCSCFRAGRAAARLRQAPSSTWESSSCSDVRVLRQWPAVAPATLLLDRSRDSRGRTSSTAQQPSRMGVWLQQAAGGRRVGSGSGCVRSERGLSVGACPPTLLTSGRGWSEAPWQCAPGQHQSLASGRATATTAAAGAPSAACLHCSRGPLPGPAT